MRKSLLLRDLGRRFAVAVAVCGIAFPAIANGATPVALTTNTSQPGVTAKQREVTATLLALLEVEVSQDDSVQVVERMDLDTTLQEMLLNRGLGSKQPPSLNVGKLTAADVILNAQFLPPNSERKEPAFLVRVVEARTGGLRGVTTSPADELNIDQSAAEIARYLSAVLKSPKQNVVTVAVGSFESKGRFDRLRPLETGLRDLLTNSLAKFGQFQVLQRSDMQQLAREMDLLNSGLVDVSGLPKTLPNRGAGFLVDGTINERNDDDGTFQVVVSCTVTHVRTRKQVNQFEFVAAPQDVLRESRKVALLIAGALTKAADLPAAQLKPVRGVTETKSLLNRALADLHRFSRKTPIGYRDRDFSIPDFKRVGPRRMVSSRLPLAPHLLRKAIDRLESVLFIQPPDALENRVAEYALGFCYSFHLPGVVNLERSEQLLRRAFDREPKDAFAAQILQLYAETAHHHDSARPAANNRKAAAKQMMFAFEYMPPKQRTYEWARMLEAVKRESGALQDPRELARFTRVAADRLTDIKSKNIRKQLAIGTSNLAAGLMRLSANSPAIRAETEAMLQSWAESDQAELQYAAAWSLAHRAAAKQDHAQAAKWYQLAAESYVDSTEHQEKYARDNLRIHAARHLRMGGDGNAAMKLLKSFDPTWQPASLNRGYYDVEVGLCHELLGEPDKAIEVYVNAAEVVPGLVNNSEVVKHIHRLGGVPLDEERDVDVRVIPGPNKTTVPFRCLATDGDRLFAAGAFTGKKPNALHIYDIRLAKWQTVLVPFPVADEDRQPGKQGVGRITALSYAAGSIWVGTDGKGVWRYQLAGGEWTQFAKDQGLPDDRVTSVVATNDAIYAGVGTSAAGGLVRIDDDVVHVFDEADAPGFAATHIVFDGESLFARTNFAIHQLNVKSGKWTRLKIRAMSLFEGDRNVWASAYRKELYRLAADDDADTSLDDNCKSVWFPKGAQKAGYLVRFVIEQGDQVWFGGSPWSRFQSSGFYRLDLKTGEFVKYGPRDGFPSFSYDCYAGVFAVDRLWIANGSGLLEVTPRE